MPQIPLAARLAPLVLLLATAGTGCEQTDDAALAGVSISASAMRPAGTDDGMAEDEFEAGPGTAAPDSAAVVGPETAAELRRIAALAAAQNVADRPYGEIVQWVGEQLRGRPYTAGLLDAPDQETLTGDLTQFDCVLYIENVLAVARGIATGDTSEEAYIGAVREMRYRGGEMDGYCSRLHYFSEWIADNERRGAVRNVTAQAGGVPFEKRIAFMSEHRSSYPRLADDAMFACATRAEAALAGLELVYIPEADIAAGYAAMQPGDVVAMATSIGGLDVTHTGFVHVEGGKTGFMHASLTADAVKVSPDLAEYVAGIRNQVGIIVARPTDPRTGG